jgi:hypothetical protein
VLGLGDETMGFPCLVTGPPKDKIWSALAISHIICQACVRHFNVTLGGVWLPSQTSLAGTNEPDCPNPGNPYVRGSCLAACMHLA